MSTPMTPPPPDTIAYAGRDPSEVDESHLNAISICHFVWGGLLALFSCFPLIHVFLGVMIMTGKVPMTASAGQPQPMDPKFFGLMFIIFGSVFILIGWTIAALTIASGLFIRRRRRRIWSIVIAAINCAIFPFGTVLGVFSLMVLLRDSVRYRYESAPAPR